MNLTRYLRDRPHIFNRPAPFYLTFQDATIPVICSAATFRSYHASAHGFVWIADLCKKWALLRNLDASEHKAAHTAFGLGYIRHFEGEDLLGISVLPGASKFETTAGYHSYAAPITV